MKLISFHKEVQIISDLAADTLDLIHHTYVVNAIKRLVDAHDILEISLKIEKQYLEEFNAQSPWAKAASLDLDKIRCELVTQYSDAFKPNYLLPKYYKKMGILLKTMDLRLY